MLFMHRAVGIFFISILFATVSRAQDTLPHFSATARGTGKILISWHNRFPVVSQISIQRSTDSLKNFTTLITVPDPTLPENGVMDTRAAHPNFYYRLFIVLESGRYLFSPSQRPRSNTGEKPAAAREDKVAEEVEVADAKNARILFVDAKTATSKPQIKSPSTIRGVPGPPEIEFHSSVFVRKGDSLVGQVDGARIGAFRDSLLTHTKDTLVFVDGDTLLIKPFVPKEVYKVSPYVFTGKYGNIHVSLPGAATRHYSVKFYDEGNRLLFELSEIRDSTLILDKTNFQHSGWFHFELYDGVQLKEKNKLFIPKEF
ncbi:MAG TPA: hypothetical protein VNU72_01365 [Puia sp.]|jgi:hypothetical protein|nr:hypothetical protein [Puia sp.]